MSDANTILGFTSILGIGGLLLMLYKNSEGDGDDNDAADIHENCNEYEPTIIIPKKHSGIKLSSRKHNCDLKSDDEFESEGEGDEYENDYMDDDVDEDDENEDDIIPISSKPTEKKRGRPRKNSTD
jgi:hypothetical protein